VEEPMKTQINDPIHNPFHNRFHVRVHSRHDEMQAHTQMIGLRSPTPLDRQTKTDRRPRYWIPALAGAFALVLIVVFSAALSSH
jgi:hypothetical protein